jgi:hypothetical protein
MAEVKLLLQENAPSSQVYALRGDFSEATPIAEPEAQREDDSVSVLSHLTSLESSTPQP